MKKSRVNVIVEKVTEYEVKYDGALKHGYESIEEFKKDLAEELTKNGVIDILPYYSTFANAANATNSTEEKRKELIGIVLMLQGLEVA